MSRFFAVIVALLIGCYAQLPAVAVDYPVVYVAVPRTLDTNGQPVRVYLQDVTQQQHMTAGSHLRILRPDGTDEVLYQRPEALGGVLDPKVSLDGTKVYFSATADTTDKKFGTWEAPINLYELTVATGAVRQLTFSTQAGDFNTGACEVPGGRLIFTSTRNRLSSYSNVADVTGSSANEEPVFQLFTLQLADPENTVEQVGFLNLRGALHPELMLDGRVMFSTREDHGFRAKLLWGLWAINPDGRNWSPLFSAFGGIPIELSSRHFQSQTPDGRVQIVYYYHGKMQGYGNLLDFLPGQGFGSPFRFQNLAIADAAQDPRTPFQPVSNHDPFGSEPSTRSLTPWATGKDAPIDGVSHPSAAPDGILVSTAVIQRDVGSGNTTNRPREAGIYLIPDGEPVATKADLVLIRDTPEYWEVQPRALVPWATVYGSDPPEIPWLPDAADKDYGYVGTSSVYVRESAHTLGDADDATWAQGADTRIYDNSEIHKLRVLFQAPTPRGYKPSTHWEVDGVERMGVVGEVPLRKFNADGSPILDSQGNPDTSFLLKIRADESWIWTLLDATNRELTKGNTWHQVRPGEVRTDCRGCHAHHQPGPEFAGTVASQPDYEPADLTGGLRFVEWFRDVKPIMEAHCVSCHSGATPAGGFAIDDNLRNDAVRIMKLRSAQSRLLKAVHGELPGVARMPKDAEPLTEAELWTLATWVDTGSAKDKGKFWLDLPPEGELPVIDLPDPPTPDECEELQQQIDALMAEIAALQQQGVDKDAEILRLLELIRAAQAQLEQAE